MIKNRLPRLIYPFVILLIFWANGLAHLGTWPLVHEDEPWIMSPGYTFWSEGRFASDLFAGFYHMEQHYYGLVPVFALFNGGLAQFIGLGLFQTRFGIMILMVLALVTTYSLGRQLFSAQVGLMAIIFLTFFRIAAPFYHLKMGIPFADAARIARYDMAVPIFGLLALLSLSRGLLDLKTKRVNPSFRWPLFFLAGLFASLASLTHAYGVFWLPALGILVIWLAGRNWFKPSYFIGIGFILPWIPYAIFVASGWQDFLGQHLINRSRAALTDPNFYLNNLFSEPERYHALNIEPFHRLATLLFLTGWPLATLFLFYRAFWAKDNSARIILVPLVGLVGGFALLVSTKTYTYLATVWPLIALDFAVGAVYLWHLKLGPGWWQPLLTLVLLAAILEGSWSMLQFQRTAAQVTPYNRFTAELGQFIPPGSRILAFQQYWLGLSQFSYRSMLVPAFLASRLHVRSPITFYQALAQTDTNIIIDDEVMQTYMEEASSPTHSQHQYWLDFNRYLADHHARILAKFRDPSYGRVTIYLIPESSP